MHTWAVVEIAPTEEGKPPENLIRCAYRASQTGSVAFILNGIAPQAVDLVLDPIVPGLPLAIPGVLYLQIQDDVRVHDAVRSAQIVFVATDQFRETSYGLRTDRDSIRPVDSALAWLNPPVSLPRTRARRVKRQPGLNFGPTFAFYSGCCK